MRTLSDVAMHVPAFLVLSAVYVAPPSHWPADALHSTLMPAALTIGHHFSISAL
jgi:hypothetical protein